MLERLLASDSCLRLLVRQRLGRLAGALPAMLVHPLLRAWLRRRLRGVERVLDFQLLVNEYLEQVLRTTTDGFQTCGLEHLPSRACLFISNHRDIVLDPALVNHAIYHAGHGTAAIAIGDNLLGQPHVEDLMRLNRSFIVPRSLRGPRELLRAFRHLSAYIRHSVVENRQSVWIAQRSGRAKDGMDQTEIALIKMLAMAPDFGKAGFSQRMRSLCVVPVTLSYEYDPCDQLKARELEAQAQMGSYHKAKDEDIVSMARGITGWKGRVAVTFSPPLDGDLEDAAAVARQLDQAIHRAYRLYPGNLFAWRSVEEGASDIRPQTPEERAFERRLRKAPESLRHRMLEMYANPVRLQLRAGG